jgi:hypothetical protein
MSNFDNLGSLQQAWNTFLAQYYLEKLKEMCQELEKLSNKCEPKDLSATMPDLLC